MDIETYGRVSGILYALPETEHAAALTAEGVTREQLDAAWHELVPRMSEDAELYGSYTSAYRRGLESRVGGVRDLTEDEYRDAEVARRLQKPPETAELTPAQFLVAQYRWMDRLLASKREAARMEASVLLALYAAQGQYEVRPLPPPRLATRVRARLCPFCDAPKVTMPRTPQVYCDYCGGLMGYDHEAARVVTNGIDPAFVTHTLIEGIRDEPSSDDGWRWVYATDMALCPEGWSPRIRQPAFREALIEWSLQTTRVANEPEVKAANARVSEAWLEAIGLCAGWVEVPLKKRRRAILTHLRTSDEALELEVRRFEALGLFDTHPDGLVPDVFRATYRGGLVDQWRSWVDGELLDVVRAHADGAEAWLQVPEPELERSTCGCCGAPLAVVPGARALICEGCGIRLDAERPRFPCPSCGAGVVVLPEAHEIPCGHCGVVFLPG